MVEPDSGWRTPGRWLLHRDRYRTGPLARPRLVAAAALLLVAVAVVSLTIAGRSAPSASPTAAGPSQRTSTVPAARRTTTPDPHRHARAVSGDQHYGSRPSSERKFLLDVATAQDAGEAARTDRQRQQVLSHRNDRVCHRLSHGRVSSWAGVLVSADRDGTGRGVVEIDLADHVQVGTWNNPASDADDQTRLRPGGLLRRVLALHPGDRVRFSGRLVASDSCVNDSRVDLESKLADPEFIVTFSSIRRAH